MERPVAERRGQGRETDSDGFRVLYVDDDAAAQSEVRAAFEAAAVPMTVLASTSAADALDVLDSTEVHCVVSEYALPGQSGLDLLRTVSDRSPALPFVLFTAVGSEGLASEALGAGASDYLPKTPLTEQSAELAARVVDAVSVQTERQGILDRMTDAFFALDEDWQFTYLNERGREVINRASGEVRSTDELLGANIWSVVPDAVGTQFYEEYTTAMTEQTPRSFEAYYEPMSTWFEVRTYPSPSGLSVYFQDVTERHERAAAMADRERVLEELYRVIAEKGTSFEEKVDQMLQIGRDVLGTDCAALSAVEGDDYVFEVVYDPNGDTEAGDVVPLETTNCERAIVTEETLVLADIATEAPELTERAGFTEQGIACYLGTPVYVDGEVTGTFCFYDREAREEPFSDWDVTLVELMGKWVSYERERQRRREELTRERNRLDDFASLVSHDLRNPLNLAVGRLELMRDGYDGDPEHFEAVEGALDRMEALIDDLLVLARSGDHVVETTTVDVETIVTSAWASSGSDAGAVTVADGLTTVEGDSDRLQQLFENLFRNAVEHGRPDVNVRVGPLEAHDGFYVADDGPGIPADERHRVLESGYTTNETGTGFGLSIVEEIVEAHGGELRVTESESGGARFEIAGLSVS